MSGGPYTDIVTLTSNTVSYANTSLATSTTYYYVVRATNTAANLVYPFFLQEGSSR